MSRGLTVLMALLVGVAIGYVLGSQTDLKLTAPEAPTASFDQDPALADLELELARVREENEALRKTGMRDQAPAISPPAVPIPPASTSDAQVGSGTGSIRVTVTDADGNPRKGARVTAHRRTSSGSEEKSSKTGVDGIAEIGPLLPGSFSISVRHETRSSSGTAQVVAGETAELTVALAGGDIVVHGMVRHRDRGPLADAYVRIGIRDGAVRHSFETKSAADGSYRLTGLPAGHCILTASGESVGRGKVLMRVFDVTTGEVVLMDVTAGVESLYGAVTDAATRQPVVGVSVRTQGGVSREVKTDDRGQYRLLDLTPGKLTLVVSVDGYGIEFFRLVEVPEVGLEYNIELSPAATLNVVITGPDGEPWSGRLYFGIHPVVKGEGTSVGTGLKTDAEGRAVYRRILPGNYKLTFKADGVGMVEVEVKVSIGANSLEVQLR